MASEAEKQPSPEPVGHSGATGWEALIPLDWSRLRHLTNEPVPQHLKRWWFSLGGTPAYLFLIQITTGILLTFYYHPGAEEAYESVRRITYVVPYGWFLRSVHMWSSNLMIVTLILHLLRVFFTRSYRSPRTLNWVFGVVLLLLTLSMGFTGYSLVYEQLSFWGATVATNLTESVPLIGPAMAAFIRGGPDVGSGTMTRLFLLHIGLLPGLMIGVLGLHLTFVRLHGVTEYEFEPDEDPATAAGAKSKRRPAVVPMLLAVLTGVGAAWALLSALTGHHVFDLVGYEFLSSTSRVLWLFVGLGLAAGAVGLWMGRLGGLYVFLAADVLVLAKLTRDLLTHEAANTALWTVGLLVLLGALVVALVSHRRFREKANAAEGKTYNFFPEHALTELLIGTGLLFALTMLCLLFPSELGEQANPQVTPEHIKPEWYFYFQFRVLKLSPGIAALGLTSLDVSVLLTGVLLAILFLWPWIDSFIEKLAPGRNLPVYIGIVGFLVFLTFTVWEAMVP